MSVNKVILVGRTGSDIDVHYFENGGSAGRLSLATNSSYVNKSSGEKVTTTEWHNLVFKNKLNETVEKFVNKGDLIYIEGKLKTRSWDDGDGKKYLTEVHVDRLTLLPNPRN